MLLLLRALPCLCFLASFVLPLPVHVVDKIGCPTGETTPPARNPGKRIKRIRFGGSQARFLATVSGSNDLAVQLRERKADHRLLQQMPHMSSDVLIDVGANLGTFTVMLAKLFPQARILALEPAPATFALLCHNLRINNVTNVIAHNLAMTVDGRNASFWFRPEWPGTSQVTPNQRAAMDLRRQGSRTAGTIMPTYSITLTQLLELHHVHHIRLLKMDCEGCEYEVQDAIPNGLVDYTCGEIHPNLAVENKVPCAIKAKVHKAMCGMWGLRGNHRWGTCVSGCSKLTPNDSCS
eukprot:NODE_4866_length_1008_cov_106.306215_g4659_i0.p1 GENE.NODE_4866_length_1008_cov_106.306215_g4659_i0~~NODE_4866_length_1008_cov_106.306215_g4659_i0.p1  ORF type:complete len:293 (+),score=23.30 NODE_4866_length_1008_cov_106.306215_g4659_i0:83-961(+)